MCTWRRAQFVFSVMVQACWTLGSGSVESPSVRWRFPPASEAQSSRACWEPFWLLLPPSIFHEQWQRLRETSGLLNRRDDEKSEWEYHREGSDRWQYRRLSFGWRHQDEGDAPRAARWWTSKRVGIGLIKPDNKNWIHSYFRIIMVKILPNNLVGGYESINEYESLFDLDMQHWELAFHNLIYQPNK